MVKRNSLRDNKKVFLIHFQPIELFPPALNLIEFFGNVNNINLYVSTNKKLSQNNLKDYVNKKVKIYRPSSFSKSKILQYVNYAFYYFSTLFLLLWHKPDVVLYVETLSAWPALFYRKLMGNKFKLMVHYHEYTDPESYEKGMWLSRNFHSLEKKMYKDFFWISQTNENRLEFFIIDNRLQNFSQVHFDTLPNYPSITWQKKVSNDFLERKKMVFIGSLGYKNMYLKELVDFVNKNSLFFSVDFYSYNIDSEAKEFLLKSENENIRFIGGIDYSLLPEILPQYHIGLVLYKPFSINTIHAVSNKVFEYLACGLDVWYSSDMVYTDKYITENSFPKVLKVEFKNLENFNWKVAINREGLTYNPPNFYYESLYPKLLDKIMEDHA